MAFFDWLPVLVSCIAVAAAFWQGFLAKQQLENAKQTRDETAKLLDDIKQRVTKIEMISDETRQVVKNEVSKLVDKQDENFKVLLNAPRENSQNEMMVSLLPALLENPERLAALLKLSKQMGQLDS